MQFLWQYYIFVGLIKKKKNLHYENARNLVDKKEYRAKSCVTHRHTSLPHVISVPRTGVQCLIIILRTAAGNRRPTRSEKCVRNRKKPYKSIRTRYRVGAGTHITDTLFSQQLPPSIIRSPRYNTLSRDNGFSSAFSPPRRRRFPKNIMSRRTRQTTIFIATTIRHNIMATRV